MATLAQSSSTRARTLIGLVAVAILLNYIDRGAIGIGAPLMKTDLRLSATEFGVAVSAFFWIYAPIQFVIGRLCDRFSVYRVYGGGVLLWAVSTFLTGFIGGLASLVMLRLFLGIGESVAFPGSSKMIARHVPSEQRGAANALVGAAIAVGPLVGTVIGGFILFTWGWREMFLTFGLCTLAWVLPWTMIARSLPRTNEDGGSHQVSIVAMLRCPSLWAMSVAHFTFAYGLYFVVTWLPLFLVQARGHSLRGMTIMVSLVYASQAVSSLILGWISDAWSRSGRSEAAMRKGMLAGGYAVLAFCIIGIEFSGERTLPLWLVLAGAALGVGCLNIFALAQMFAGPRVAGTWVGVQNALANSAGIVGPVITGFIIDQSGGYAGAFALAAAVLIIGALWSALAIPSVQQIAFNDERMT